MKRYTFFTDDYPVVTCKHCYEDQNENYTGPAIDRLAEYEATGLMPAEVAALQYQLKHVRSKLDADPVDEFKFHRLTIDNEGVPEVKLQFGDRFVILRTDPVDVREVVHGRWCFMGTWEECSICGHAIAVDDVRTNYCPNCGAKMDGGVFNGSAESD